MTEGFATSPRSHFQRSTTGESKQPSATHWATLGRSVGAQYSTQKSQRGEIQAGFLVNLFALQLNQLRVHQHLILFD